METEIITIPLNNKIVALKIVPFDTDIDTQDLLTIHQHNLLGEILTFPVLMNRVGILRAEAEEIVSHAKLDVEVYHAKMKEHYRKKLLIREEKGDKVTYKAPTQDQVDNSVLMDEGYQAKKKELFRKQRDFAFIENFYWAVVAKDKKLDRLSEKIRPEDFENEILEETINGVMIKSKDKLIK